jgi:hypothetical protein
MGNQWGIANGYINLGFTYFAMGEDEVARSSLLDGIKRALAISARNLALEGVVGISCLAEREGNFLLAARLIGMAEPLANIDVSARIQPLLNRLQAKMDGDTLQLARQEGSEWGLDEAIEQLMA